MTGRETHCARQHSEAFLEVQTLCVEEVFPAPFAGDYDDRILFQRD